MAFTGAARSLLVFGADPQDPDGEDGSGRVLAQRGNLAKRAASLASRIEAMVKLVTADPYMDGWLRDLDMSIRRFHTASDLSAALRDLWTQLEIGYELAEAVSQLGDLTAQAARALTSSSG